jgi:protein O-GlcNAc transferase
VNEHINGRTLGGNSNNPNSFQPLPDLNQELQRAVAFHRAGDMKNAQAGYKNVLAIDPRHPDALHLMGCMASTKGHYEEAVLLIRQAIQQFPNSDIYYNNLGNALARLNRHSEAVDAYKTALKINPSSVDALNNLATNLKELGKTIESLSFFQKALQINPDAVEVHNNMGNTLTELGQIEAAMECYHEAIRLKPDYAIAYNNLGSALRSREQFQLAVESYCRSIEANPEYAEAINNLGETLADMGKPDEAISFFKKAIEFKSDFDLAISNLLYASIRVCDWATSLRLNSVLDNFTEGAIQDHRCPVEDPFLNLVRHDSPRLNYKIAAAWSALAGQHVGGRNRHYHFMDRPRGNRKLVIGYLSNNFHDHPMSHLFLGLLAMHNRDAVEVRCFSSGRDDGSSYRSRIAQASDKFVDIRGMSHREAADCIFANKVDILVDLMGHTKGNRLSVCALKPAPIQVRYLGMAGTTGATFFDYLIADAMVVPEAHFPFYSERIVHLPHCYQVNDNQQEASQQCFQKKDAGLPESGFVFCSFNQPYKIDPVVYGAWMKILQSVPQSVLWLQGGNALAEQNLIRHAEAGGVDGDRIIFAPRVPKAEHLARLSLADLGLDTRLVSGAATTSDALWAGVPVITLKGSHFSSRMSASILSAVGLGELVMGNIDDYVATATSLATCPELLLSKKDFLKDHLSASKLFDSRGIANHIEAAYLCMWQRYCSDGKPKHIASKDLLGH